MTPSIKFIKHNLRQLNQCMIHASTSKVSISEKENALTHNLLKLIVHQHFACVDRKQLEAPNHLGTQH